MLMVITSKIESAKQKVVWNYFTYGSEAIVVWKSYEFYLTHNTAESRDRAVRP